MKEIIGLSYEQTVRMQFAIKKGLLDGYERDPRGWRHSFVGSFIWKYPKRVKQLMHIIDIVGHTPTWEDITDEVVKDFVDETKERMAVSSSRTICAEFKAFLNENKKKIAASEYNDMLTLDNEKSQFIYLTNSEVDRFIAYRPRGKKERFCYRNFCVELLTGARLCDCKTLTIHNCDIQTGLLSYVPQKTPNIIVRVPIDERHNLRTILSMDNMEECGDDTVNENIRMICKRIGLYEECTERRAGNIIVDSKWKLVTTHTARRSFATNLYLAGFALEDIAMMMGHGKNIETTKRYICAERNITPNIMAYFQEVSIHPVLGVLYTKNTDMKQDIKVIKERLYRLEDITSLGVSLPLVAFKQLQAPLPKLEIEDEALVQPVNEIKNFINKHMEDFEEKDERAISRAFQRMKKHNPDRLEVYRRFYERKELIKTVLNSLTAQ